MIGLKECHLWRDIILSKTFFQKGANQKICYGRKYITNGTGMLSYGLYKTKWWILKLILKACTICFNALNYVLLKYREY